MTFEIICEADTFDDDSLTSSNCSAGVPVDLTSPVHFNDSVDPIEEPPKSDSL